MKTTLKLLALATFSVSWCASADAAPVGHASSPAEFKVERLGKNMTGYPQIINEVHTGDAIAANTRHVQLTLTEGCEVLMQRGAETKLSESGTINVLGGDVYFAIAPKGPIQVVSSGLVARPAKFADSLGPIFRVQNIDEDRVFVTSINGNLEIQTTDDSIDPYIMSTHQTIEISRGEKGWIVAQADGEAPDGEELVDPFENIYDGGVDFEEDFYTCEGDVVVRVLQEELAGSGSIVVEITTEGDDLETLTLNEIEGRPGHFEGTISAIVEDSEVESGVLEIEHNQQMTVTYKSQDYGVGSLSDEIDTARFDCLGAYTDVEKKRGFLGGLLPAGPVGVAVASGAVVVGGGAVVGGGIAINEAVNEGDDEEEEDDPIDQGPFSPINGNQPPPPPPPPPTMTPPPPPTASPTPFDEEA